MVVEEALSLRQTVMMDHYVSRNWQL